MYSAYVPRCCRFLHGRRVEGGGTGRVLARRSCCAYRLQDLDGWLAYWGFRPLLKVVATESQRRGWWCCVEGGCEVEVIDGGVNLGVPSLPIRARGSA